MCTRPTLVAAATILLLLPGCKAHGGDANQMVAPAGDNSATPNLATESSPADSATGSATAFLTLYVGKHPSEQLSGRTFLDQPAVKAAVEKTVPDPAVRDFIFHYDGPDAPIVDKNGRLLAWGCERHNCGYHNWSILIAPEQSDAEVCFYHDNKRSDGTSRWFLPGGRTETARTPFAN